MAETARISGEAGDGIITLGELFTKALVRSGFEALTFRTFPAEVRGGLTVFQVRFDPGKVLSLGDEVDLLVAFNEEAWLNEKADLGKNGILIYDSDAFQVTERGIGLPLTSLSGDLPKNMVALGALAHVYSIAQNVVKAVMEERFGTRLGVLDSNLGAFERGLTLGAESLADVSRALAPSGARGPRLLVSGNEAVCLGALAAGLGFYAGYPITPASDILEFLALHLPRYGGVLVQTEDELAALGAVVGASYAGKKAMTATSGPGISLMAEFMGYSSMAEVPMVIVDCQRGGPSTGLPTKTEQSDLNHSVFCTHGDAPRAVLAPFDVEDCYYQAIRAFNIAEECQMPVVLLSDQSIAHRVESVEPFRTEGLDIRSRMTPAAEATDLYERYRDSGDGVSPMPVPGKQNMLFITTGLEHDTFGRPNYEPGNRTMMTEKRHRKLALALRHSEVVTHGTEGAPLRLVSWGSTHGAVREAVERANRKGIEVMSVHPKLLYPFPGEEMGRLLEGAERVIVPEVNFVGQFARLMRGELGLEVETHDQCTGLPFRPAEILKRIEEAHRGR